MLKLEIKYFSKDMYFYFLLKIFVKSKAVNTVKYLFDMLKNLLQMQLKLLRKQQFENRRSNWWFDWEKNADKIFTTKILWKQFYWYASKMEVQTITNLLNNEVTQLNTEQKTVLKHIMICVERITPIVILQLRLQC